MGKSTAADRFERNGIAVFDADAAVHRLYEGEASSLVEKAFPGTVVAGAVDRARLGRAVIGNPEALAKLEAIVHPLVREAERRFLREQYEAGARIAVLEIPLLFETGGDAWVDVTVVMSAPEDIQRERVLSRAGMTREKFERLLAQQLPDSEKRARADYVVDTSGPIEDTGAEIDKLIESLRDRTGMAIARWMGES